VPFIAYKAAESVDELIDEWKNAPKAVSVGEGTQN